MAQLVYALNVSLDGYVDHMRFAPDDVLFRHFIDDARSVVATVYGSRMYEVMRYWDEDRPEWGEAEREYALAWRVQPKWVVSRTVQSVGPNATLVANGVETVVSGLKQQLDGIMEVSGPELAASLGELGLIDEYRLYVHPVVLGSGKTFFAGTRPALRFKESLRIGQDVVRLSYVPANS